MSSGIVGSPGDWELGGGPGESMGVWTLFFRKSKLSIVLIPSYIVRAGSPIKKDKNLKFAFIKKSTILIQSLRNFDKNRVLITTLF